MKIEFIDKGVIATTIVTSTVFEFRLHNRAVDTALFLAPSVRSKRSGFFILKRLFPGKQPMYCVHTRLFSRRLHDDRAWNDF